MDNKELTSKAHLITVKESDINFLHKGIDYPFIEINCHGAERITIKNGIGKKLAKKMFLFLEAEYKQEIKEIKDNMFTILKSQK